MRPLLLFPLLVACTAPASRPDRVDDPARSAAVGFSGETGGPQTFAAPFRLVIGAAARATASHDGRGATFRIPARPGQRVSVSLSRDETRDMPPLHTVEGVAGIDGVARLALPDVDHARAWFWAYAVDGIVLPGGALAR